MNELDKATEIINGNVKWHQKAGRLFAVIDSLVKEREGLVAELQKRRQEIDAERNEYKIGTRTRESLIGKIIMINEVLGLIEKC